MTAPGETNPAATGAPAAEKLADESIGTVCDEISESTRRLRNDVCSFCGSVLAVASDSPTNLMLRVIERPLVNCNRRRLPASGVSTTDTITTLLASS